MNDKNTAAEELKSYDTEVTNLFDGEKSYPYGSKDRVNLWAAMIDLLERVVASEKAALSDQFERIIEDPTLLKMRESTGLKIWLDRDEIRGKHE